VAVEAPGKVELEQCHLHRAARAARQANELVHRHRRRAEQLLDIAGQRGIRFGRRLETRRRGLDPRLGRAKRLDHVLGILDQRRAVADQLLQPWAPRVERRAGHRHHLAPASAASRARDQRSRARRCLDDHASRAEPAMIRLR
jgi:hypothetical protein